jgi:hypothetical protein
VTRCPLRLRGTATHRAGPGEGRREVERDCRHSGTARGALAHFLNNRFYIGEVVYRGETHAGEHERIVDHATFEAVQAKLAENIRARRIRVKDSPAVLIGRIFETAAIASRRDKIMRCRPRRADFAYAFFVAGTGVPAIFRFTEPRKRALVK